MPSRENEPSALERVAGSTTVAIAAAGVAAAASGPLAPFIPAVSGVLAQFLPVLANALAATRQAERVQEAFRAINAELEEHGEALRNMSDEQYKLVNEAVVAILHTTDPGKIEYLKRAVANGLQIPDLVPLNSAVLSRVVRDISAAEADFLIANFQYQFVTFDPPPESPLGNTRYVDRESDEAIIVSGLMALGLLVPGPSIWDGSGLQEFAKVTVHVINLLRAEGQAMQPSAS